MRLRGVEDYIRCGYGGYQGLFIEERKLDLPRILLLFRPKVKKKSRENLGKIYRYNKVLVANGIEPDLNFDIISEKEDFIDMLDFSGYTLSEIKRGSYGAYLKDGEKYVRKDLAGPLINEKTGKEAKDELVYFKKGEKR